MRSPLMDCSSLIIKEPLIKGLHLVFWWFRKRKKGQKIKKRANVFDLALQSVNLKMTLKRLPWKPAGVYLILARGRKCTSRDHLGHMTQKQWPGVLEDQSDVARASNVTDVMANVIKVKSCVANIYMHVQRCSWVQSSRKLCLVAFSTYGTFVI